MPSAHPTRHRGPPVGGSVPPRPSGPQSPPAHPLVPPLLHHQGHQPRRVLHGPPQRRARPLLHPLRPVHLPLHTMRAISHRARRTRSWAVALKSLMLTHAILLCSHDAPPVSSLGRLPFDLSDFRDRYSPHGISRPFATFVRSYFNFLDRRSVLMCYESKPEYSAGTGEWGVEDEGGEICRLRYVERLQELLGLILQVQPYGDGMEVGLVVEAMDGIVTEILEVYGEICNGIASTLVGIFGGGGGKGKVGIRVLRRAVEQSTRLAAFFEVCKGIGVVGEGELLKVENVPEEDVDELERMVVMMEEEEEVVVVDDHEEDRNHEDSLGSSGGGGGGGGLGTVVTGEWVVFEEEGERWGQTGEGLLVAV